MRTSFLVGVLVLSVSWPAIAQEAPAVDVGGGYSLVQDQDVDESFHGWVASLGVNLTRWFGLVGEVGGNYKTLRCCDAEIDLSLHSYMGGARVAVRRSSVVPFGQFLVGAVRGSSSGFGSTSSDTRFALQPGGGVDIWIGPNAGVRVGADYRRVFLEDGEGLNQFRFHAGVVLGLGRR